MKTSLYLRLGTLVIGWLWGLTAVAQEAHLSQLQSFVRNVETFNRIFPQEKVYLHLDNTGYFIGETLWYKAYLTRPLIAKEQEESKVLYVELVDPFGEVVETQKLHLIDRQAHGQFSLNRLRTSGFYEVRAYTRYMTNFDARGVFSRVLPIFNRPDKEGDYSRRHINEDFVDARQSLPNVSDTTAHKELKLWRKGELPTVQFYPEGGALVEGLPSVVAFDVMCRDSVVEDVPLVLLSADGDTLTRTNTIIDGRGSFVYTPTEEGASVAVKVGEAWHNVSLPKAESVGAVMRVVATGAQRIALQIQSSEAMHGQLFGLSLLHNGEVEAFDTVRLSAEGFATTYRRSDLSTGVHQLTLFDKDGRIWAERLFFVAPDTASATDFSTIAVTEQPSTLQPHQAVRLQFQTLPHSRFSLAVHDADATTNAYEGNAVTYLLLSSEVKGFVRNAESYLKNDAPTRLRADLLMLTQAWRRYNWRMMAGRAPFVKQQPLEDTLYIDGQLRPRQLWGDGLLASKKKKARAKDVGGIDLRLTLYNKEGKHFEGYTTTDSLGYYAFAAPPLEGDWTLFFSTRLDEKLVNYPVTVNRWFSPEKRSYSPFETELLPTMAMVHKTEDVATLQPTEQSFSGLDSRLKELGVAVIKRKRIFDVTREAWEVTRRRANARSQYHFDMEREVDRYIDAGRPIPTIATWLMSKDAFAREFYGHRRAMGLIMGEQTKADYLIASKTAQQKYLTNPDFDRNFMQDTMWVNNNIENYYSSGQRSVSSRFSEYSIDAGSRIDEVDAVYVALQGNVTSYFSIHTPSIFKDANPFHVFIYPRYKFNVPTKGFRRTTFKGFNEMETFHSPDYSVLPPDADYRRTLYWNPNVLTDANGTAEVQFYNNSRAQSLSISAEGVTHEGVGMVGK